AQHEPVVGRERGIGDLPQVRGRERTEEEALVEAAQEARYDLPGHAHVAHQGPHGRKAKQSSVREASRAGLRGLAGLGNNAAGGASSRPHRDIPSVERLLRSPGTAPLLARWKRERVVDAVRVVLGDVRRSLDEGGAVPAEADLVARTGAYLDAAAAPRLQRVVNATGVVLHPHLGRAPLAEAAVEAITLAARGAVNLELDVASGRRGRRDALVEDDLRALTGAEAALVVNNNAAAVLLAIAALAAGREVVVSRGELVEIGGRFRMPAALALSGARLREGRT